MHSSREHFYNQLNREILHIKGFGAMAQVETIAADRQRPLQLSSLNSAEQDALAHDSGPRGWQRTMAQRACC